jgi:hypothetical protein
MLINVIVGLVGSIPIILLALLFKYRFLKPIGVLFCIGVNGFCLYVALVKAALVGIE